MYVPEHLPTRLFLIIELIIEYSWYHKTIL